MKTRLRLALILNVVLPGSGLVLTQRELSGVLLVLVFVAASEITLIDILIAPESIPALLEIVAIVVLCASWFAGQWLLRGRLLVLGSSSVSDQIELCYGLADDAIQQNRLSDAVAALHVALTVDDECLETHLRLARLFGTLQRFDDASSSWKFVRWLDHTQRHRDEMNLALQQFPSSSRH